MKKIKLKATRHPYYCSKSNYYSNEQHQDFENWKDYLEEWGGADLDMNLIFRWDITNYDNGLELQIFRIAQRKGIFQNQTISNIKEEDMESITKYLKQYWVKINALWTPFSN